MNTLLHLKYILFYYICCIDTGSIVTKSAEMMKGGGEAFYVSISEFVIDSLGSNFFSFFSMWWNITCIQWSIQIGEKGFLKPLV